MIVRVLLVVTGIACGVQAADISTKTDGYAVAVSMKPDPPTEGVNTVFIRLTAPNGKPITDAKVSVRYFMPSLPGRPPMMDYEVPAVVKGSAYEASIHLSMAGSWTLEIAVYRAEKAETVRHHFIVK